MLLSRHNWTDPQLRDWAGDAPWRAACAVQGECARALASRRTLRFEHAGRGYYLKQHYGVGWREIFKNLCSGKWPRLSAVGEMRAALRLDNAGLRTLNVRAVWRSGVNPARLRSFVVTDDIAGCVNLQTLCERWGHGFPSAAVKNALVRALGDVTGRMFAAGVNHRDYYLCHFLLPEGWAREPAGAPPLHLIDLHRAGCHSRVPRRQMVRDLSGLHFSALQLRLSQRDLLRFARAAARHHGRLRDYVALWPAVQRRADAILGREHRQGR